MDEHDDDLESAVSEDAEIEEDAFPDTADEFEGVVDAEDDEDNDADSLDEDEAEL